MKNRFFKPHLTTLGHFLLLFSLLLPVTAFAQFTQLVNIPGLQGDSINDYVRALFYIAIGIAAMLAVVKLVIAGAKYMLSDVANTKQTAIADIRGAIFGLLLILATVIILNTISQNIVETDIGGGLPEFRTATQQLDLSDRFDRVSTMCTPQTGGENPDGVTCQIDRCERTSGFLRDMIGRSCQEQCDEREGSEFIPNLNFGGTCYWPNPDLLAYEDDRRECEAAGNRFVVDGLDGVCLRQASDDERNVLEQRLGALDSSQREEIITALLNDNVVGAEYVVFEEAVLSSMSDEQFTLLAIEPPTDATALELSNLNDNFENICRAVGERGGFSTQTISAGDGQYRACVR